jgi:PEP-CTERM motif
MMNEKFSRISGSLASQSLEAGRSRTAIRRICRIGFWAFTAGCAALGASVAHADTISGFKALVTTPPTAPPASDTINSVIVTNIIPHTGTATTLSFQVEDGTGSIEVFSMPKTVYTPTIGDIIDVTGLSEAFHGLYETASPSPYVVTVDSTGNTPPALTSFTTSEFQPTFGSSLQSFIGTLSDVTFTTTGTFTSNDTLTVTDGTLTATVFIPSSDPLIGTAIPTGLVNITGYYGEFDDAAVLTNEPPDNTGHEFDATSIVSVPEPASMSLLALGGFSLLARRRRSNSN